MGADRACGCETVGVLRVYVLAVVALVLAGCGGSRGAFVCPATSFRYVTTPLTGRTAVLGGPRVLLDLGTPSLRGGTVVLGRVSGWPGWFALKTHFLTRPSFGDGSACVYNDSTGTGSPV